ncbi:MAG: tetratricopeptide repeat protein [Cyclobacteriaceae bacterium]|nr:tetratricopeptide repeat protein [Cyclobacteriaceae bacterium]
MTLRVSTCARCLALGFVLFLAATSPADAQREKKKKTPEAELSGLRMREAESVFTEGMKYFLLEDYAKALGAFQRAAELNPQEAMIYFKMAEVYTKSQNPEDLSRAATSIETALKLERKNKYFYLLAADIYASQNQLGKAEQVLETLTREADNSGDHLYQLAAIYLYDRKPEEALKTYNRAEAVLGINEVSSLQKQKIYFDLGKNDQGIAEGEKLMEAYPDEERYVVGIAETLAQKGQMKKAVEYLERFLAAHPEGGPSKILLAGLYRDTGREQDSRRLIREAIKDPSIELSSKLLVVQTYATQIAQNAARKVTEADLPEFVIGIYKDLERQYPEDPNVYIAGGNLYISLHQKAEAEKAFLSAIQRGSASFEAWQNLLALEAETGKFDSLVFHSEQGMEIFPNQAILYYFNGYGHISLRNYREAASSLERAKKLSASNPGLQHDINSMLGDAYNGAKEYLKSDQAYEAALAHTPNDPFVLNNYSYYLALRKEHLEKAERMAAQVIKENPDNSTYLDTYAWVLYQRDKFKEARKVMEQALVLPGVSSVHYEHYGDILFQLGEVDNAVRQWEKARSMTNDHEVLDRKIANRRPN